MSRRQRDGYVVSALQVLCTSETIRLPRRPPR